MKVTFRTNLGSMDASAFKLNHEKCTIGAIVDVDDAIAAVLVSRGIADALPVQVKAVAKEPEIKGQGQK